MVPGVYYPDSSPKPSVEQVAEAGHSMVDGTGTHMVLWALLRNSVITLRG
jgi:hypothetical protein